MFAPTRKLIIVLIGLFLGEAAIMALINYLSLPAAVEAVFDASGLILVALPILYVQFVRPMIRQYQAVSEARKNAETLLRTSAELARSLDMEEVLSILMRQIIHFAPYDMAGVCLLESPARLVSRARQRSGQQPGQAPCVQFDFDPRTFPLVQQALDEQKSVMVADMQQVQERPALAELSGVRGWAGIPLVALGKVIGLVGLGRFQPGLFDAEQIRLAEGVASQAAVAIQNAQMFEQTSIAREQLRILTRKNVEVQERERQLIAHEIQEDLAQSLAAVLLQVRYVQDQRAGPETVQSGLDDIDRQLQAVLDHLRKMAVTLRPATLDYVGLVAAVQQDLGRLRSEHGLKTNLQVTGLSARLPERVETILYRIVQDALANVAQHAKAARVDVHLTLQDGQLEVVIEDDGLGFRQEALDPHTGLGLLDMRERAEMLGGKLSIESAPGKGTMIYVSVPHTL